MWLLNTIFPTIRNSVSFYETAHELWSHLKERSCVSNGSRICQLQSQISDCKQHKTEPLADYFGRLTHLWDELSSQEVAPTCSKGGTHCEVIRFLEQQRSDDHLHRFLIGLDDCYGPLRSHLLAQAPMPTVARAYQIIAQEERLRATRASSLPLPGKTLAFKVET